MPLAHRTDITDPVTPSKLEVVLKPIRLLQLNGKINEENFYHSTYDSYGIPLHSGSLIRNINDLVDSAKTFDGRSVYTGVDTVATVIGATSVYHYFRNNTDNNEKDLFAVHAQVCGKLYKQEETTRDIDFKLSYSRDDIKASFRTKKELKKKIDRLEHRIKYHALSFAKMLQLGRDRLKLLKEYNYKEKMGMLDYEFISLSQSIEVELPRGYQFDRFEIFGDLDWGWANVTGEGATALQVGVLYVEVDSVRDDFACFKLSLLFDQDVALSADDYVLCAGKLQYRLKRYA
jgi:hypothetical protein